MLRVLITAGPTREFFDPVRFLSNPSSGKMGFALAQAAVDRGYTVDLVTGPVSLTEPEGVIRYPVVTGAEMFQQVDALFDACDILIMVAAVCDLRPVNPSPQKVKKDQLALTAQFEPVVDILATVAARKRAGQTVVGFAAETHDLATHGMQKLQRKNLDLMAANQVGGPQSAFEADDNTLLLLRGDGTQKVLGPAPKTLLAPQLLGEIADWHFRR